MNPLAAIYGQYKAPQSLLGFEHTFGLPAADPDPRRGHEGYVVLNREWTRDSLVVEWFPILGMRCVHQRMAPALYDALEEIDRHPDPALRDYFKLRQCGTFIARTVGWKPGNPLSMHALGVALDVNWNDNPWGKTSGTILKFPVIIESFKKHGFTWGGDFRNKKDLMHFQFADSSIVLPRAE